MKTTATRFLTVAALTVALFVPNVRASHADLAASGKPLEFPKSSSIVQITPNYIYFSNGLTVYANSAMSTSDGTIYPASSTTVVFSDGTTLSPNGTITYADGTVVSCTTP